MAVAFRSVASASGTSTSPAVSVPSGAAVGDIAWVDLYLDSNTTDTDATIAGLAAAGFSMHPTVLGTQGQGARGRGFIFWKRLTAADSGTYTFGQTVSVLWEISCRLYSGVTKVGNPWIATIGATTTSAASSANTVSIPSVTPGGSDACIVGAAISHGTGSNPWTPPTGYAERYDGSAHLEAFDLVAPSVGTTGSITATSTSTAGSTYPKGYQIPLAGSGFVHVRSTTAHVWTTLSSQTVTLGTHDTGDLITIAVMGKYDDAAAPTISTATGWTLVGSSTGGTGAQAADTGPVFMYVYQKVATSGSETNPVFSVGSPSPNSWSAIQVIASPADGKTWRDPVTTSSPAVQFINDTDTASPLTGTASAFTGQPQTDDALIAFGVVPTDSFTAVPTISISATGLSDGTQAVNTLQAKTTLGSDMGSAVSDWMNFSGPATSGVTVSMTFSTGSQAGVIGVVALRQESSVPAVTASWTGSGAFTASVVAVGVVAASWTGSGAFTASSVEVEQASAAWNGSGAFSATAFEVYDRAAAWGGSGTWTATVETDTAVNAAWDGSGAFSATAFPVGVVAADWTGSGAFSASVLPVEIVSAAWDGSGAWTADVEAVSDGVAADWQGSGEWTADTALTSHSDVLNRAGGRVRSGLGIPSFDPALEPVPTALAYGVSYPFAQAFGATTMVGNQPHFSVASARGVQTRLQILYGNRDITYLFGVPTPRPEFQRATPFDFGPSTLRLPQFANPHEQAGSGRWSWLRIGKPVRYRVVKVSDGTVLKTLYRGVHTGYDPDASTLTLQIGGQATGRMGLRDQQAPLFSSKTDVKNLMRRVFQSIAVPFNDDIDATGIMLGRFGDTGMLDYAQQVLARAWTKAGNQWTVMPDANGIYQLFKRDRDEIAGTIYLDDARTSSSLHRDISEEPNAIFGRGTTPEGRRVHNGVYPGLIKIDPVPPYPFNDGRTITVGTLNSDTDTGDGISVLKARLQTLGYLSRDDADAADDEYTDDVYDAVYDMNDEAQILPLVGNMTEEGWATLFNVDAVGYSVWWSKIEPMASDRRLRRWKRTADGAIRGKNPTFDPHLLRRDKTLDFGAGFEVRQMKNFARQEFDAASDPNWVGTVTLGLGAIVRGDHTPGDPIDTADVMADWELDPGQNYKIVSSAGGELVVHCSGITYGDSPTQLTVDTRARDALPVWEVIRRNKESRGDLNRRANQQRRASTEVKDVITEFEEYGGRIEPVPVPGGAWKVFPVVAGKAGYVERIRVRTRGPVGDAETPVAQPTRFVLAVFGQEIDAAYLAAHVPNPLVNKSGWYDEDFRKSLEEQYRMAYIVGEPGALGGYHPHVQTDSGAPITGVWDDQAGFSFRTGNQPVLYVAYFGEADSIIAGGRVLWNQEIVGS